MHILTVVAHPRENSLTMDATKQFIDGLKKKGHTVEVLDLYREEFDPVMVEKDEPDWSRGDLHYSKRVMEEIDRLNQADGLAFVFPIWWYSIPAIMKGYIDRVWQYNYAYGNHKLPHERIQWIGLVGGSKEGFEKRSYDKLVKHYLNIGLSQFVGVDTSRVNLLYGTLEASSEAEKNAYYTSWMNEAHQLGLEYDTFESEQDKIDY